MFSLKLSRHQLLYTFTWVCFQSVRSRIHATVTAYRSWIKTGLHYNMSASCLHGLSALFEAVSLCWWSGQEMGITKQLRLAGDSTIKPAKSKGHMIVNSCLNGYSYIAHLNAGPLHLKTVRILQLAVLFLVQAEITLTMRAGGFQQTTSLLLCCC